MRAAVLVALALAGCNTAIHQVHVSDFSPHPRPSLFAKPVYAHAEQRTVLGFEVAWVDDRTKLRPSTTGYVDEAWAALRERCPDGNLTALTAESTTHLGFMGWTHHIHLRGLCVEVVDEVPVEPPAAEDLTVEPEQPAP